MSGVAWRRSPLSLRRLAYESICENIASGRFTLDQLLSTSSLDVLDEDTTQLLLDRLRIHHDLNDVMLMQFTPATCQLHSLNLQRSSITADSIPSICAWNDLEELNINHVYSLSATKVLCAIIAANPLAKLSLHSLSIGNCGMPSSALDYMVLDHFSYLRRLDLSGSERQVVGLLASTMIWASLPCLEELDLTGTDADDRVIESLLVLKKSLISLVLDMTAVTMYCFLELAKFKELRLLSLASVRLRISHNSPVRVTHFDFSYMSEDYSNMSDLSGDNDDEDDYDDDDAYEHSSPVKNLVSTFDEYRSRRFCHNLMDRLLKEVLSLPHLEHLELSNTNLPLHCLESAMPYTRPRGGSIGYLGLVMTTARFGDAPTLNKDKPPIAIGPAPWSFDSAKPSHDINIAWGGSEKAEGGDDYVVKGPDNMDMNDDMNMSNSYWDDSVIDETIGFRCGTGCSLIDPSSLVIAGENGLTQCVTTLRGLGRHYQFALYGLKTLFHLLRTYPTHWSDIGRILNLVVELMNAHMDNFEVQIAATASVYHLTKQSLPARGQRPSARLRAISVLCRSMRHHLTNHQLQKNAALTFLNFLSDELQPTHTEVVLCLLNAAVYHNENMIRRIALGLSNTLVCSSHAGKEAIAAADGIALVLQLIRNKLKMDDADLVMETAWSTLWNLTDETLHNCEIFLNHDGMSLFMTVIGRFPGYAGLIRNMLGLLGNVAEMAPLRPQLRDFALVSKLAELLNSNFEGIEVSYNAAGILANLCAEGPAAWTTEGVSMDDVLGAIANAVGSWFLGAERTINYHSLRPIITLAYSSLPAVQFWAVWAMANLCVQFPLKYPLMVVHEGAVPRLSYIATEGEIPKMRRLALIALKVSLGCINVLSGTIDGITPAADWQAVTWHEAPTGPNAKRDHDELVQGLLLLHGHIVNQPLPPSIMEGHTNNDLEENSMDNDVTSLIFNYTI